jgi:hypothetical protein
MRKRGVGRLRGSGDHTAADECREVVQIGNKHLLQRIEAGDVVAKVQITFSIIIASMPRRKVNLHDARPEADSAMVGVEEDRRGTPSRMVWGRLIAPDVEKHQMAHRRRHLQEWDLEVASSQEHVDLEGIKLADHV